MQISLQDLRPANLCFTLTDYLINRLIYLFRINTLDVFLRFISELSLGEEPLNNEVLELSPLSFVILKYHQKILEKTSRYETVIQPG